MGLIWKHDIDPSTPSLFSESYSRESHHPFRVYSPGKLKLQHLWPWTGTTCLVKIGRIFPFFKRQNKLMLQHCLQKQEGSHSFEEPSSSAFNSGAGVSQPPCLLWKPAWSHGYLLPPPTILPCYFQHKSWVFAKGSWSAAAVPSPSTDPPPTHTFTPEEVSSPWPWSPALILWLNALTCCTNEYDSRF